MKGYLGVEKSLCSRAVVSKTASVSETSPAFLIVSWKVMSSDKPTVPEGIPQTETISFSSCSIILVYSSHVLFENNFEQNREIRRTWSESGMESGLIMRNWSEKGIPGPPAAETERTTSDPGPPSATISSKASFQWDTMPWFRERYGYKMVDICNLNFKLSIVLVLNDLSARNALSACFSKVTFRAYSDFPRLKVFNSLSC